MGLKHIDVSIIDISNPINHEHYFDVGGSSRTANVNNDVDVGIGAMDRNRDNDLLASFCQHEEHHLLLDSWRFLINSVGHKFEGGAHEFLYALQRYAIGNCFEFDFMKNDKIRIMQCFILKN